MHSDFAGKFFQTSEEETLSLYKLSQKIENKKHFPTFLRGEYKHDTKICKDMKRKKFTLESLS